MIAVLAAAAATLVCSSQLPDGSWSDYRLSIQPKTVVMTMRDGAVHRLPRMPSVERNGWKAVGGTRLDENMTLSVMVDDQNRVQQTFMSSRWGVEFVYGRCR